MEAFAEGTPVLASNTPEHREAIIEGKNGFLFANDNPSELKNAIVKIQGISNLKQITSHALKFYQDNFRFTETGKNYNTLYSNLLA